LASIAKQKFKSVFKSRRSQRTQIKTGTCKEIIERQGQETAKQASEDRLFYKQNQRLGSNCLFQSYADLSSADLNLADLTTPIQTGLFMNEKLVEFDLSK
jgi:hypothetical protein